MSCGGRVYKGDTVTISVPFDVSGYTDLTITYSTTGDSKIVKTQDEVEIEGGFITYTFTGDELDLLPDGVIYYTINYEVDGTDYVASTNTNLYLKTPAGYSGKTAEDYYQEGYEAGLENCSGGSECNLTYTAVTLNQYSGGEYDIVPSGDYDGFSGVHIDATPYGQKQFDQGYAAGHADCPECSGGCQIEIGRAVIDMTFGEYTVTYEAGSYPYGSGDAWSAVTVDNLPYRNYWYQSGRTEVINDVAASATTLYVTRNGNYTSDSANNIYYKEVIVNVQRYRDIIVNFSFDMNNYAGPTIHSYSGMSVRNIIYNNNIIPEENEYGGYTYGGGNWPSDSRCGFKLLTQSESLFGSGSVEFLFDQNTIPASGNNNMFIKVFHLYPYGKTISAGTNYVRSTFIENGEPENTYWYKIEWDLTDEVSIKDDYDEAYAEGYQAGLAACQGQ